MKVCCFIPVKIATYIIGVAHIFAAFYLICVASYLFNMSLFITSIVVAPLATTSAIILLVGVRKSLATALLPHLCLQIPYTIVWIWSGVYLSFLALADTGVAVEGVVCEDEKLCTEGFPSVETSQPGGLQSVNAFLLTLAFVSLAFGVLQIWFFTIIQRCFAYLKQKAADDMCPDDAKV